MDSFHEEKKKKIGNVKDLFTSDNETPVPQGNIEKPNRRILVLNKFENKTDEIYYLHNMYKVWLQKSKR